MMRAAANSMLMHRSAPPAPAYWGLTFTAEEAGSTIEMGKTTNANTPVVSLEYSTDAATWTPFVIGTTIITLANIGDSVFFRAGDGGSGGDGVNLNFGRRTTTSSYYNNFVMSGSIAASGDISSILDRSGTVTSLSSDDGVSLDRRWAFHYLFRNCTSLTSAPTLPATTLSTYAYSNMFYGCTSLTTAPELPATTLNTYCYSDMFRGCTSLSTTHELPAKKLNNYCYQRMFRGCTSLVSAPKLPATVLANNCYSNMFYGCTALQSIDVCVIGGNTSWLQNASSSGVIRVLDVYGDEYSIDRTTLKIPEGWRVEINKHCPYFAVWGGDVYKNSDIDVTGYQYTLDFGETWTDWDGSTLSVEALKLYMFATKEPRNTAKSPVSFGVSGSYTYARHCGGNIGSLLNKSAQQISIVENALYRAFYSGRWLKSAKLDFSRLVPSNEANHAFSEMFRDCTSLISPPTELPATTLTANCYNQMFRGCTSLVSAPELPATQLAGGCYNSMFRGCTSLVSAPELPATQLANWCYSSMFYGCTALSSIKVFFTAWDIDTETSTKNWVYGVADQGSFICPATLPHTADDIGVNKIPTGWTVETF